VLSNPCDPGISCFQTKKNLERDWQTYYSQNVHVHSPQVRTVKKISRNLDFFSSEDVHTTVMNQLSLILNGAIAGGEKLFEAYSICASAITMSSNKNSSLLIRRNQNLSIFHMRKVQKQTSYTSRHSLFAANL
jgi:hypothetical protein